VLGKRVNKFLLSESRIGLKWCLRSCLGGSCPGWPLSYRWQLS